MALPLPNNSDSGTPLIQRWEICLSVLSTNAVSSSGAGASTAEQDAALTKQLDALLGECPPRGREGLLSHGTPPALHRAARAGRQAVVHWLIATAGCPVDLLSAVDRRSALSYAAATGDLDMVKLLAEHHRAELGAGEHPLLAALRARQLAIANYLFLCLSGSQFSLPEESRQQLVAAGGAAGPAFAHIVAGLQTPAEQWRALFLAQVEPSLEQLGRIVQSMSTAGIAAPLTDDGQCPLHLAAAKGWCATARWLVQSCGVNVDIEAGDEAPAPAVPAVNAPNPFAPKPEAGRGSLVALRRSARAARSTTLHAPVSSGRPRFPPAALHVPGSTPLHFACSSRKFDVVCMLVKECRATCTLENDAQQLPIHFLVSDMPIACIDEQCVRLLAPLSPPLKIMITQDMIQTTERTPFGVATQEVAIFGNKAKVLVDLGLVKLHSDNVSGSPGIWPFLCTDIRHIQRAYDAGIVIDDRGANDVTLSIFERHGTKHPLPGLIRAFTIPLQRKQEELAAGLEQCQKQAGSAGAAGSSEQLSELAQQVEQKLLWLLSEHQALAERVSSLETELEHQKHACAGLQERVATLQPSDGAVRLPGAAPTVTLDTSNVAEEELVSLRGCIAAEFWVCGVKSVDPYPQLVAQCIKPGHAAPTGRVYTLHVTPADSAALRAGHTSTARMQAQAAIQILSRLPVHEHVIRLLHVLVDEVPAEWLSLLPESTVLAKSKAQLAVYQFCEKSLATHMRQLSGAPPVKQALLWSLQLCHALQHLANHNVLHRDIRLENLHLNCGRVVLGGFGMSTRVTDASKVLCWNVLGNEAHMAPEIVSTKLQLLTNSEPICVDYTKQAVFELGVIMFEMLASEHPLASYPDAFVNEEGVCSYAQTAILDVVPLRFAKQLVVCDPALRPTLSEAQSMLELALAQL